MKSLYTMVGMKFLDTEDIVKAMQPGAEILLLREPHNEHDRNAIAVYGAGLHLAYVKGTEAVGLAREMDSKGLKSLSGAFRVTADRWPQVEVDSR